MTAQIIALASARRAAPVTVPRSPLPVRRGRGHRPDSREERFQQWRKALALAEFYSALRKLQLAAEVGRKCGYPEAAVLREFVGDYFLILEEERKAVARCILTPAPTRREIEWKRVALRRKGLTGYITEAKALAAIEADERWHTANPYRRAAAARQMEAANEQASDR